MSQHLKLNPPKQQGWMPIMKVPVKYLKVIKKVINQKEGVIYEN